jgi:hypothetical protein
VFLFKRGRFPVAVDTSSQTEILSRLDGATVAPSAKKVLNSLRAGRDLNLRLRDIRVAKRSGETCKTIGCMARAPDPVVLQSGSWGCQAPLSSWLPIPLASTRARAAGGTTAVYSVHCAPPGTTTRRETIRIRQRGPSVPVISGPITVGAKIAVNNGAIAI